MNLRSSIFSKISKYNEIAFKVQNVLGGISTGFCPNKKKYEVFLRREPQFSVPYRRLSKITAVSGEDIVQIPKRVVKKKNTLTQNENSFSVAAFSTAEQYNLKNILQTLPKATSFVPSKFTNDYKKVTNCIHLVNASADQNETKHLFFFREGSVVMWNIPVNDSKRILDFLRFHEVNSFKDEIVANESERMSYCFSKTRLKTGIFDGVLEFSTDSNLELEKYAVSNAMALSVHLGTHEAALDQYIATMAPVTEDLKTGAEIKMSREEVLRKTGQLFDLKHKINLSGDLLDTPDFYWDREELENLYQTTFNYFCINKRTKVMNEKINHCIELVELLSSHLNDKHHVRLEWMIIILIMVEVAFEVLHYVERYLETQSKHSQSASSNFS